MGRGPLLVVALLLPLALAGCSGGQEGRPEPEWTEVVIPARRMLDLEYALASGAKLPWKWEALDGQRLAFQALYVEEGGKAYPLASEYGSQGAGERTVPQEGRYDLTWDNQGSGDITVRFVARPGHVQRVWPAGQGPGCAPLPATVPC